MMPKQHVFSITEKDFEVQHFRGSGPGGQHRNKTSTAVRIVHRESGAAGSSQEFKSQKQNRTMAFRRLTESRTFRAWLRRTIAEAMAGESIEQQVDRLMQPENIRVEVRGENGWEKGGLHAGSSTE